MATHAHSLMPRQGHRSSTAARNTKTRRSQYVLCNASLLRRNRRCHSSAVDGAANITPGENGFAAGLNVGRAHVSASPSISAKQQHKGNAASKTGLTSTLLIQCPDQKGVIASLAQLLYGFGCNIIESDQFTEVEEDMFFQRVRFDYSDCIVGAGNVSVLEHAINEVASRYQMTWQMSYQTERKRVAILVSKEQHCLYDLLIRHRAGELECEIPIVLSNHPDLEHIAKQFDIPFVCLPIKIKDPASKAAQEQQIADVVAEHNIDLMVMARYMQVLSPAFCERFWKQTINIHHSFLPAFEGGRPYHRAHERGVKLVGATAHYATSELDAGPIIEQDIVRITHRDGVEDMVRKGRDLERLVLSRAVRWHLESRVLIHGNKTVVFQD